MRNLVVLVALAAVVGLSACGGTGESSSLAGASTPTAPRTPTGRHHSDPHKSCDAQGINSTQLGEGSCTEGGTQYVVGNYGALIRLKTLGVTIAGVSVAPADTGKGKTVHPRFDAFLRVTLEIQNRDKVSHRWGLGQTMLGIGEDNYPERVDVERTVHEEALATTHGGLVGPGETLRGDVLFDITAADYEQLQRKGRFFIWNFGQHASLRANQRGPREIGQIRLYAAQNQGQGQGQGGGQ